MFVVMEYVWLVVNEIWWMVGGDSGFLCCVEIMFGCVWLCLVCWCVWLIVLIGRGCCYVVWWFDVDIIE